MASLGNTDDEENQLTLEKVLKTVDQNVGNMLIHLSDTLVTIPDDIAGFLIGNQKARDFYTIHGRRIYGLGHDDLIQRALPLLDKARVLGRRRDFVISRHFILLTNIRILEVQDMRKDCQTGLSTFKSVL